MNLSRSLLLLATILIVGTTSSDEVAAGAGVPQPRRVTIEPRSSTSLVATIGKPLKLSARLEMDDGTMRVLDDDVTWTSANPAVLRVANRSGVEAAGAVTPLRAGIAGVTITWPRVSDLSGAGTRMLGDSVTIVVREP